MARVTAPEGSNHRRAALWLAVCAVCLGIVIGAVAMYHIRTSSPAEATGPGQAEGGALPNVDDGNLTFVQLSEPARTEVRDSRGTVVAVFTEGARAVRINGPERTFAEPTYTTAVVTTNAWIRLAPEEWHPGSESADWFRPWLRQAVADRSLDVMGIATEYLVDRPEQKDSTGVRYAGDAAFGPVSDKDPDGRAENSDFLDYLGVPWTFVDGKQGTPNPSRYGDIDCSGFLRLVYGYRLGYPLRGDNSPGPGLPRRAYAMAAFGPGVEVFPDTGTAPRQYDRLQAGDLVFFDLDSSDGPQMDHSGIYLGVDDAGHHRFISSRSKANGPTFGDYTTPAVLDGGGHFSAKFRVAKRL